MSDFDQNRQSPGLSSSAVWRLAALSAALLFCSVLAAKFVGDMVDSEVSQVAAAFSTAAPARKGGRGAVDPTVTGSIRRNGAPGGVAAPRGQAAP